VRSLRRAACAVVALIAAGVTAACRMSGDVEPAGPDVIVILLDSLRADTVDASRGSTPVMPGLSEWADRHVRFTLAQAPSSSTPTSVSSMFTSLPVPAFSASFHRKMPHGAPALAELLRGAGYRTLGYSANPNCARRLGHDRGFTEFVEAFDDPDLATGELVRRDSHERITPAERLFARVKRDLGRVGPAEAVFAYVHVFQPHAPYRAPAGHRLFAEADQRVPLDVARLVDLDRERQVPHGWFEAPHAHYDELAHYVDSQLARFLSWLERHERFGSAAVIVVSDHGEGFGEHGRLLHNTTTHEEMIRIPLSIRPPGPSGPGRALDFPVDLIDLAPTICAIAGVEPPPSFQGIDLLSPAAGALAEGRELVSVAVAETSQVSMRAGRYKLLVDPLATPPRLHLFEPAEDPTEARDLAAARPAVASRLLDRLNRELQRLDALGFESERADEHTDEELERLRSLGYAGRES
jgi:arylsulfatase A-like enzyme